MFTKFTSGEPYSIPPSARGVPTSTLSVHLTQALLGFHSEGEATTLAHIGNLYQLLPHTFEKEACLFIYLFISAYSTSLIHQGFVPGSGYRTGNLVSSLWVSSISLKLRYLP